MLFPIVVKLSAYESIELSQNDRLDKFGNRRTPNIESFAYNFYNVKLKLYYTLICILRKRFICHILGKCSKIYR